MGRAYATPHGAKRGLMRVKNSIGTPKKDFILKNDWALYS
jgi:hypothetical protein